MIVDRDIDIYNKHFSKYKYGTIKQIEKIFFKEQENGYNIASRRLKELDKAKFIKTYHDDVRNRNIYVLNEDKIKLPSLHRMILLDTLAELNYSYNVELFEIEREWNDGKIRSDGFTIFTVGTRRYHFFIEVHLSNNYPNLEKYDTLFESGDVQKYLNKDHFPRILFVSDSSGYQVKHAQVIQIDTMLKNFSSILF